MKNLLQLFSIVVCVAVLGCGGGGVNTYPVKGVVVYKDGKPVSGGRIIFEPADKGNSHSAIGEIQQDGKFELRTRNPGDGAATGKYKVAVMPPPIEGDFGDDGPPKQKVVIDPKYQNVNTSGLEYTVEAKPNDYKIELERPKR